MNLSGTSDAGWVVVDLRDVADAIAALRDAGVPRDGAPQEADEQTDRSAAR